jgi:hypothetical protein
MLGGLKKAIRLTKHVKADAAADGTDINLPSFDVAAALYHADQSGLRAGAVYELAILGETQRFLDYLTTHEDEAKALMVPDGSRPIFNTSEKLRALRTLSIEMDDLMVEVAKEQDMRLAHGVPSFADSRAALARTLIKV